MVAVRLAVLDAPGTGLLTELASEALLLLSCLEASCLMTRAAYWQTPGQDAVNPQQLHH